MSVENDSYAANDDVPDARVVQPRKDRLDRGPGHTESVFPSVVFALPVLAGSLPHPEDEASPVRPPASAAGPRGIRPVVEDQPVADPDDPPHPLGDVLLVRDDDDRVPLGVQLVEEPDDLLARRRVEEIIRLFDELN